MKNTTTITSSLGLVMLCLIFFSCTKAPNGMQVQIDKKYKDVDSELWIYFYNFEQEAKARGHQVDLTKEDIIAYIEALNLAGPVGVCVYGVTNPSEVILDKPFWERAGDSRRELIVFHELGHCYLKRPHREDTDSNGTCLSIMRSGVEGCIDNYNSDTRESYIDELFAE